MAQQKYYPEEILVEKMQSSEYGWLDYINHFSAEWQEEYAHYCEEKGLTVCEDSADPGFVPVFKRRTIGSGYEIRQRITSNHHNIRL